MFVAVGFVLTKERREDRKRQRMAASHRAQPVLAPQRRSSQNV
jgi:hypothetical protein